MKKPGISDGVAAEVMVRGCCSQIKQLPHHLLSSQAPFSMAQNFAAEVLLPAETEDNGPVKSRVLFCNTRGCNDKQVQWSNPRKGKKQRDCECNCPSDASDTHSNLVASRWILFPTALLPSLLLALL